MSNQVDENNNSIDNQNTDKKSEKELEPTEKQDNQHQPDDEDNVPNELNNNENIENSKDDQENQDNEQEQQNQSAKSNVGRNRHITTNEEKEILSKALPEYLKLPNRTTDRQNKERNVAKKLKALSPECDEYWNYKKVRDWFNNNNPDKRNKNLDTDNQHLLKKAVMVPGSAPIRIYPENSSSGSFIQENQMIPEFNNNRILNQYIPNQNRSQFVKFYNANANSPTSSAILSANSNSKVFPISQDIQPTSHSEIHFSCVNNMISSAQRVASVADGEKNNIESLPYPQIQQPFQQQQQSKIQSQQPQLQQQIQLPIHQPQQIQMPQIQQSIRSPPSSQIQPIQPPQIQPTQVQPIQPPQIQSTQIQPIQPFQPPQIQPPQIQSTQIQPIQPPQIQPPQIQSTQIQPIQPPQIQPPQIQPIQPTQPTPIHQLPQVQPIQQQQSQQTQIQQPILSPNIQPQIQYQSIQPPQIQPPIQLQTHPTQPQMQNHPKQPQLQRPPFQAQYQPPTHVQPPPPLLSQLLKRSETSQNPILNPEEEENMPKSPTGERISAELPKNMSIGKNSPKKKSSFKKAFEKDKKRYEDLQRKLETENPPEDIISQSPYEKYQQQKMREQEKGESPIPNFIEFRKNPDSTLFVSSSFKSKSKNKSLLDDSNEPDPLPLVPEEELRNYFEKLKTITLTRISQLLKIIDERKNLNLQMLKMKFRKRNNKDDNFDYSSSSETEISHKDEEAGINEKEKDSSISSEKPTTFKQNDQLIFDEKTEKRMNELIDFYHNKFGDEKIVLTLSIGSTKKSNPPIRLTEKSLIESGEFSPENKNRRKESIEEVINEKKCIVNFGRNTNFESKIHVPKDVEKNNDEKVIKFYRGDFEKKEVVPLSVYDNSMQVEASLFFDDSDEIFLISYDPQEKKSLFVFNDSFIQAPFKKANRMKAICKFPSSLNLNNIILATDGNKLVYFDSDSMNIECVYNISVQNKQKRSLLPRNKSESCQTILKPQIEFQSSINLRNIKNTVADGNKEKVAICATSYGDVLVGIESRIFFFNKEKDENSFYSSIQLENMKNISSICAFELNTSPDENGESFSIPLIVVGDINYPTIYVFNGNDHSLVARLVGHTSGISCLYNKGIFLLSGSVDGKIIMWEFKLIPDDQVQNEEEQNENKNLTKKYSVFAYSSLTLLIHSEPIYALRIGKVGNILFLISCDSNLVRATDINRHNSSFSISVPDEFEINSLNFDSNSGEVDFILSSHQTDKFTDRMEIFAIE